MEESTLNKLYLIAFYLKGDWTVNTLISKNRNYYLQNKSGLFINITYKYGCNLPQWSLLIRNRRYYSDFETIATIGCSLDKRVESIVSDLKGRLLSLSSEAYKTIEDNKGKKETAQDLAMQRKHVIAALDKAIIIDHDTSCNYNHYSLVNKEDRKLGLLNQIHDKADQFHLDLYDLNSEQVIKIMGIIGGIK